MLDNRYANVSKSIGKDSEWNGFGRTNGCDSEKRVTGSDAPVIQYITSNASMIQGLGCQSIRHMRRVYGERRAELLSEWIPVGEISSSKQSLKRKDKLPNYHQRQQSFSSLEWIGSNPFWLKFWRCERWCINYLREGRPARKTTRPMRLPDLDHSDTAWMILEWSVVDVVHSDAKSLVTTLQLQICLTRLHALCMDWARWRMSEKWSVAYMTSEHSRRLSVYIIFPHHVWQLYHFNLTVAVAPCQRDKSGVKTCETGTQLKARKH